MKRLLVMALACLFAMACGEKQLTVEEQFQQYQERINEAIDVVSNYEIDKKNARGWFMQLSEEEKHNIEQACSNLRDVQTEMSKWIKSLSEEDKAKIDELRKEYMTEEYFRKTHQMFTLMRIIGKPMQNPGAAGKIEPAKHESEK